MELWNGDIGVFHTNDDEGLRALIDYRCSAEGGARVEGSEDGRAERGRTQNRESRETPQPRQRGKRANQI